MTTPTCHPGRRHYANGACEPCYRSAYDKTPAQRERRTIASRLRRQRRADGVQPTQRESFPIGIALRYAGGQDGRITNEELAYRTGVPLSPHRSTLTDVEADHVAVALGLHPRDLWPSLWFDYDGPHYDNPQPDIFGPTVCDCRACERA